MAKSKVRELYGDEVVDIIARVRIKLGGKVREFDFTPDVDIDYNILEDQLAEQPAKFAYWSMLLSEQKLVVSRINHLIRVRKAAVIKLNINAARTASIKIPKYELDESVELDEKFIDLYKRLIREELTLSKLYGVVEAMKMKSDNLRSLAGFKRQEMRDA